MSIKYIIFLIVIISVASCQKLDDNLFSADNSIESYKWDDYQGEREFHIGDGFPVDQSEFHTFSVSSDYNGDVEKIEAIYLGDLNSISEDTIIVYCHGNTGHMDFYWERTKLLYYVGGKSHYGVLMMDYRGFGLSGGKVNEPALSADVSACIDWLKDQGVRDQQLLIYGFSLGSIPAVQICAENNYTPLKLILEAPIGNIDAMVQGGSSLSMPASYFVEIVGDNIENIKSVNEAFLLIHGLADSFLPYLSHGKPIFENHPGPEKESILVEDGEHGDTPDVFGIENYMIEVDNFIKS